MNFLLEKQTSLRRRKVKHKLFDKLSPNEMLHIIETELDSFQLTSDFKKLPKNRKNRLLCALGLVRRLQYNFYPQVNYSLYRYLCCDYKRKNGFVLSEKTESKKIDWRKFRKLKELQKYNLQPFLNESYDVLDATANRRGMWKGQNTSNVLFLDIDKKVNPDIIANNELLPFKDEVFKNIVFDPPQFVLSKAENALPIHNRYGFWLRKQDFFKNLQKVNIEFSRVLKENGLLIMKFCTFNFQKEDAITTLNKFSLISNYSRPTKGRGKNTVHILLFKKRLLDVSEPQQKETTKQ